MPRFVKDSVVVTTSLPREAAQLRAEGFREEAAQPVKAARAVEAPKPSK